MAKKNVSKSVEKANNQKYIIVGVALGLAALGYLGYRSMLTKPEINKIDVGGDSGRRGSGYKDSRQIRIPRTSFPNARRERINYESGPTQ